MTFHKIFKHQTITYLVIEIFESLEAIHIRNSEPNFCFHKPTLGTLEGLKNKMKISCTLFRSEKTKNFKLTESIENKSIAGSFG